MAEAEESVGGNDSPLVECDFWRTVCEDLAGDGLRALEVYQAAFPGYAELVAREYRSLEQPRRIGGFRLVRAIGRGGQATVYEAVRESSGLTVALRVFRLGEGPGSAEFARFQREVEALRDVEHDGIGSILDCGHSPEGAWIAMKLLPGPSLDAVIDQRNAIKAPFTRLEIEERLSVLARVARAAHAAHAAGFVHRDIKPDNILFAANDQPVLIDFGLVRPMAPEVSRLTQTGLLLLAPHYASPEHWEGEAHGPEADVWSLGVVAYELLTGRRPFDGPDQRAIRAAVRRRRPVDPRILQPALPAATRPVLDKAMAKDASARFRTAADLAADLEFLRDGRPIAAKPPSAVRRVAMWARREPVLALALVLGAVAIITLSYVMGTRGLVQLGRTAREGARLEALLDEAFAALGDARIRRAEGAFERVLELRPNHLEALAGRALGLANDGRPEAGLTSLEQASVRTQAHPAVCRVRADLLRQLGRVEEGKAILAEVPDPITELDWLVEATVLGRIKTEDAQRRSMQAYLNAIFHAAQPRALYYVQCLNRAMNCRDEPVMRRCMAVLERRWNESAIGWFYRAEAHQRLQESDACIAGFTKVIELAPDRLSGYRSRADARVRRGEFQLALADYNRALECEDDGSAVSTLYNRAVVQDRLGNDEAVMADLARAIELRPNHPAAYEWRSRRYFVKRKWKLSERDVDRVIELQGPNVALLWRRGRCRRLSGDTAGAIEDYRALLEMSSEYAPALREMGRVFAGAERYAESRPFLERAVAADPKHSGGWHNLGIVCQHLGDVESALAAFGEAIAADSRNAEHRIARGRLRRASDDPAGAVRDFRAVVDADPSHAMALLELAHSLYNCGAIDEAVSAFDSAQAAGMTTTELFARRGVARFDLAVRDGASFGAALEDLERAVRDDVDWPEVWDALGQAQLRSGDRAGALATYGVAVERFSDSAPLREHQAEAARGR